MPFGGSTFQNGILLQNAMLNSINTNLGIGATLTIFDGAEPLNCAAPDPSGPVVTMPLPYPAFGPAVNGVINLIGNWTGVATGNTAFAQTFRIYDSGGNCAMQGSTVSDLVLNQYNISAGWPVSITVFQITAGNQ